MVKTILSFAGSLIPVLFPDKEFQPKRLGAVVVIGLLLGASVHFLGVEETTQLIELTDDVIELTTE